MNYFEYKCALDVKFTRDSSITLLLVAGAYCFR